MTLFKYGQKELDYLSSKDSVLAKVISQYGFIERQVDLNLFQSLASSIISQQISGKAAETIWNRLVTVVGNITAEVIIGLDDEALRDCGISFRKISYLKSAAEAKINGKLNEEDISRLEDDEIIRRLIEIKGVGVWTAEMLLIFSLGRMNVLSFGDLGIKKGIIKIYGDTEINMAKMKIYKDMYSPYSTVASFYLWEVASSK